MTETLAALARLHEQLEAYRHAHGAYPKALEDLREGRSSVDAWGQPYIYRGDTAKVILYSVGKNGVDERGEGDDVVSWDLLNREYYPELGPRPAVRWVILVVAAVGLYACLWLYARRKRVAT